MSENSIILERKGPSATLRLNRPGKRNALTLGMWRQMIALLKEVKDDPSVSMLTVAGTGNAFAAGADIEEMKAVFEDPAAASAIAETTYEAQQALHRFPKPTLAVIRGACVGGGCGIALCCDLRFADRSAKLGITPGKLGLVYSLADTKRLVDAVGPSIAKDILYTGRIIEATEAKDLGLIDRLVNANHLDEVAEDFVSQVCQASQFSAQSTKQIMGMIFDGLSEDTEKTRDMFVEAFAGEDFNEGFSAFMEKRKPKFS